jgi:DNA-binding MarR family transcriptional regulator
VTTCWLCGNTARSEILRDSSGGIRAVSRVECKTVCGGVYEITDAVEDGGLSTEQRHLLSGAVRHASLRGQTLWLDSGSVSRLLDEVPRPSLVEQADLVLEYIEGKSGPRGEPIRLDPNKDYPVIYGTHPDQLQRITADLVKRGLIERAGPSADLYYVLTLAGSERLEQRRREKRVAWGVTGWTRVDRTLDKIRESLAKAVEEEDFVAVGAMCRDALVSLGEAAWDPVRHPTFDGVEPAPNDFQRRLDAVIAVQLPGKAGERMRKLVKAAEDLVNEVTHGRSLNRARAQLSAHAVAFLTVSMAIISGQDKGSGGK